MVVNASSRVINQRLDRNEHERLIEESLDNLQSAQSNGGSRAGSRSA
jgi:hypothetical protein